jgi:chromosome segregation ATPase
MTATMPETTTAPAPVATDENVSPAIVAMIAASLSTTTDDALRSAKGELEDTRKAVTREVSKAKKLTERVKVAQAGLATQNAITGAVRAEVKVAATDVTSIRQEAAELSKGGQRARAARKRADAATDNVTVAELRLRTARQVLAADREDAKVKTARAAVAKHAVTVAEARAKHADTLATVAELREALDRAKG